MSKRYLTWEELFLKCSGSDGLALTNLQRTALTTNFPTVFTTDTLIALESYIYFNNKGVSFFPESYTDTKLNNAYNGTFLAFIMSNKQRIKFALETVINGVNKTRDYTYTEIADPLKNFEENDSKGTLEKDTTGTNMSGFYSDGNNSNYISDSPEYNHTSRIEDKTSSNYKRSKSIDITKTENETIIDPYSYPHINDFVNNFTPFLSIIQEYYKEYTCPLR